MYGDTGAATQESFGRVFLGRSAPDATAPWSQRAKVMLWAGLGIAGWVGMVMGGYLVWSAV